MFHGDWLSTMLSEFAASALLVGAGFMVGRFRERRRLLGKDLHQYDFYPYIATPEKFAEFSLKDFREVRREHGRLSRALLPDRRAPR